MRFPAPIKLGPTTTRWRLSDLEQYEAAAAGDPAPAHRNAEDERYLPVKAVAARYGTHVATVWRWVQYGQERAA